MNLAEISSLLADIESALTDGTVLRLSVLDDSGRRVSLFLNGRTAHSVAVDLGAGPRPTEISGVQRSEDPPAGGSGTSS